MDVWFVKQLDRLYVWLKYHKKINKYNYLKLFTNMSIGHYTDKQEDCEPDK